MNSNFEPDPSSVRSGFSPGAPVSANGDVQSVISPEQVALELPIAGPTSRILAYGIDLFFLFFFALALLMLAIVSFPLLEFVQTIFHQFIDGFEGSGRAETRFFEGMFMFMLLVASLWMLIAEWCYFIFCEMIMNGQSIGKRVLHLRVVQDGGFPLTFRGSLVRNLLRFVDVLPTTYLTGLVAIVCSSEVKRLGDLAAGTVVIRLDRVASPARPLDLETDDATLFHFDREQLARCSATERTLARQTLQRIATLPREQRDVVLQRSVDVLREKTGFAAPVPTHDREAFLKSFLNAVRRL